MIRALLALLRLFGDVKSISKGRYHKRIYNRSVRRAAFRSFRWR